MMKKKAIKPSKIICVIAAVLLVLAVAIGIYANDYYKVTDDTFAEAIVEETDDYILYGDKSSEVGFIFYPGAKVEAASYAPILSKVAEEGVCCLIMKMPMHLAILDMDACEKAYDICPDVEQWYIGGHSLGGAMAASYAAEHQEDFAGLILLAAYPTSELTDIRVLSLYGTEDKVLNREKYEAGRKMINNVQEVVLEGGNHAQFGYYGEQEGDGVASMDAATQWELTAENIVEFVK